MQTFFWHVCLFLVQSWCLLTCTKTGMVCRRCLWLQFSHEDGDLISVQWSVTGQSPRGTRTVPVGVNQSRPQLGSTGRALQHSVSWVMLVYGQPLPDFKLLHCVLELLLSKMRVHREGSCLLFSSCNRCLCCVGRTKYDTQAFKVLILLYDPRMA